MKVVVDAACDVHYSSFYIYGLKKVFGKIRFSSKYFQDFKYSDRFFAFVVLKNNSVFKKVIVDFTDSHEINQKALQWCDIYGKVNFLKYDSSKIVPIGPSFGINVFNPFESFYYIFSNLSKAKNRIQNSKKYISDFKAQYNRLKYDDYFKIRKEISHQKNYVFFASSIWKKDVQTNLSRLNFVEACVNNSEIQFEGGFASRSDVDLSKFEKYLIKEKVPYKEYVVKTMKSHFVFNTPAVKHCLGWKLGEFLILGKLIISTNLERVLPNAENDEVSPKLFFTDNDISSISNSISKIIVDDDLVEQSSKRNQEYFDMFLSPESVITYLIHGNYNKSGNN